MQWEEEKEKRDKQIQDLFEQIEPLWTRLGESQEYIDKFIETHHGSRESHIEAYQEELARITEIRRASLSDFVIKTRKEIETLQDALMMSDDEKADFGALIDDRYTEELLEEHEEEARRLRAEVELRGAVLPKVKEWFNLCRDEEELEKSANDPDRFKRRGKWLFEEEKKRNRVEKRKPKVGGEVCR